VGKLNLENPLDPKTSKEVPEKETPAMLYDQMLKRGEELLEKPLRGVVNHGFVFSTARGG